MIPLLPYTQPFVFLEYNGYKFNDKCKTSIFVKGNEDSSKRVTTSITLVIKVSGFITPRMPIPGHNMSELILLEPKEGCVNNPFDLAATTDTEVFLILQKLSEQGKTLRYIGFGAGDIYVNTLDPNTGKYIPDLNYGPKPKVTRLYPVGLNKAWKIEWECEVTLSPCWAHIDFNLPGKRIQEYNFTVNYNYDADGMCRRTVQGHLTIIPPLYRIQATLPPQGAYRVDPKDLPLSEKEIIDKYNLLKGIVDGVELSVRHVNDKIIQHSMNINKLLQKNRISGLPFNPDVTRNRDIIKEQLISIGVKIGDAGAIADIYDLLYADTSDYNELSKELDSSKTALREFISMLDKYTPADSNVAGLPEQGLVFFNSKNVIPKNATFGPFSMDNQGNIQNYETADQYREYIEDSIRIPYNFTRINKNYTLSYDKRTITFSIVDQEKTSFSVVPGYTKVDIRHVTRSVGPLLCKHESTLSASFTLPKFIYGTNKSTLAASNQDDLKKYAYGLANQLVQFKEDFPDPEDGGLILRKTRPDKRLAYGDFLKVVFQRFGLALVMGHVFQKNLRGKIGNTTIDLQRISILPKNLTCDENVTGNSISFSLTYHITNQVPDFFPYTGHGLPAIIATDLKSDSKDQTKKIQGVLNIVQKFQNLGVKASDALQQALTLQFGKYTDNEVFERWVKSQKYAILNSRGTSDLVFNRAYDVPINMCSNSYDPRLVIPTHGESHKKVSTQAKEVEFTGEGFFGIDIPESTSLGGTLEKTNEIVRKLSSSSSGLGVLSGAVAAGLVVATGGGALVAVAAGVGTYYVAKNAISWFKKTFTGSTLDIDILLEESALENISPENPFAHKLFGPGHYAQATYKDNQTIKDGDFFNGAEGFVTDKFLETFNSPPPEKSWIEYQNFIEYYTQNQVIRHKLLPNQSLSPKTDPNGSWNIIEDHFDSIFGVGPDNIMGESIDCTHFLENLPDGDIIQTAGSPSNIISLKGQAIRIGYPIVPPTIITYGGMKAFQLERKFIQGIIGQSEVPIIYGKWDISYMLPNTPVGYLGIPLSPTTETGASMDELQDDYYEEYYLSDEFYYDNFTGGPLDIEIESDEDEIIPEGV